MKNMPKRIYLQVEITEDKYGEVERPEDVTWCEDKINDTDVEYIRVDLLSEKGEKNERFRINSKKH